MTWPKPKHYTCPKAVTPPAMKGDPRDWPAPWTDSFMDIEGPEHDPQPRFQTQAKLMWDAEYLYVGAWLQEPYVWGTLTERDSVIFHDNDFEIFIDPDDDHHQYLEIEINALNTVWDLTLPKPYRFGGSAVNEWDALGMKHAVHVEGYLNYVAHESKGWGVTFAIPWKDLAWSSSRHMPPKVGEFWRINFSRVEWDTGEDGKKIPNRPEHNWVWSPQWQINMHAPEFWGFLIFGDDQGHAAVPKTYWPERCQLITALQAREKGEKLDPSITLFEGKGFWIGQIQAGDGTILRIREDGRLSIVYT